MPLAGGTKKNQKAATKAVARTVSPPKPPKKQSAPTRVAANQVGPAPTLQAVRNVSVPKRTRPRRDLETRSAAARSRRARQEAREREERRSRQPYARGIAPTSEDLDRTARLLEAPGMGLVATRRVAPKRTGMESQLAKTRRGRQSMLSRAQFKELYGGYGSYDAYLKHVAKARRLRVGELVKMEPAELSPRRFERLRRSEQAVTARVIAKLDVHLRQAGQRVGVPVLVDWEDELGALPPQVRKRMANLVDAAIEFTGTPYVYGSAPGRTVFASDARARQLGFDCSGFVEYVYQKIGIDLTPGQQAYTGNLRYVGREVSASEGLNPGDMVFFREDYGHMGMYVGDGWYIHAPQTGDVVRFSRLSDRTPVEIRRVIDESGRIAGPGARQLPRAA